jgi:hypothetical protein
VSLSWSVFELRSVQESKVSLSWSVFEVRIGVNDVSVLVSVEVGTGVKGVYVLVRV